MTEDEAIDAIEEIVKECIASESELMQEGFESGSWKSQPADADYEFYTRLEGGEPIAEVVADRIRSFHFIVWRNHEDDDWQEI